MLRIFCAALMLLMLPIFTGCGDDTRQSKRKEGDYQQIKLVMSVNGTNIATDTRVCLQSKESNTVWLKNTRTISTNYPICHNEWQCVCYLLIV